MAGRFSIEAVFKAVDRVTAPVARMQNRVSRFTRSMRSDFKKLNRTVGKFGQGAKRGAMAVVAGLALTSVAMADVISTGAQFEQTLVSAAAKFPGEIRKGTIAFQQLEDAARITGSTTEFTARQSAEALNFLAMAGFTAEASIAALPGVVDLATIAQIDLGRATDIATDSLGAFNLLSDDAAQNQKNLARVTDVLAKTSTSANTTIDDMFEALKQGAPVGVAAGQSVETIATLIGTLANAGIKGTRAGTGLKNIFLAMSAPASDAAKVMRALGIQTANADGSIRDAIAVFEDFNRVAATLPDSQKMQVFNRIFGKIPIAAAINLTNASKKMGGFREELIRSTGITEKMAAVIRDTLQGRLNSLTSSIEGVKISILSYTDGPLVEAVEKTTAWVRANEDLIATNVGGFISDLILNFSTIVDWMKKVGAGVLIFMALSVVLKSLIGILTIINLLAAANPITLIVLGVLALIAAVAALVIWADDLADIFMALPLPFKILGATFGILIFFIKGLRDNFAAIVEMVTVVIATISGLVVAFAAAAKIMAAVKIAVLVLSLAFAANPIGLVITAIGVFNGLAALLITKWEPVSEFFAGLWERLKRIPDAIGDIAGRFGSFLGFTRTIEVATPPPPGGAPSALSEEGTGPAATPQVLSPQERIARSIEEQRTTNAAQLTIKDETGRAEITEGQLGPGITLATSGAF